MSLTKLAKLLDRALPWAAVLAILALMFMGREPAAPLGEPCGCIPETGPGTCGTPCTGCCPETKCQSPTSR